MDNFNYNYNNQENAGMQNSNMYGGQGRIKCPTCGSTNLQYTTESETKVETSGGGYSGSKGCLGFLLLGPFGLLCGNCGKSQKTTVTNLHKHFWVCSDCGCKFPSLAEKRCFKISSANNNCRCSFDYYGNCDRFISVDVFRDIFFSFNSSVNPIVEK